MENPTLFIDSPPPFQKQQQLQQTQRQTHNLPKNVQSSSNTNQEFPHLPVNSSQISSPTSFRLSFPKNNFQLYKKRRSDFSYSEDFDGVTPSSRREKSSALETSLAPKASPENSELDANCFSSSLATLHGVSLESLGSLHGVLNGKTPSDQRQSLLCLSPLDAKVCHVEENPKETKVLWTSSSNVTKPIERESNPHFESSICPKNPDCSPVCSSPKKLKFHLNSPKLDHHSDCRQLKEFDRHHLRVSVVFQRRSSAPSIDRGSKHTLDQSSNSPSRFNRVFPKDDRVDVSLLRATLGSPSVVPPVNLQSNRNSQASLKFLSPTTLPQAQTDLANRNSSLAQNHLAPIIRFEPSISSSVGDLTSQSSKKIVEKFLALNVRVPSDASVNDYKWQLSPTSTSDIEHPLFSSMALQQRGKRDRQADDKEMLGCQASAEASITSQGL